MNARQFSYATALALLITTATATAQTMVGPAVTYQGKLDFAGDPVHNPDPGCSFEFSLWDAPTNGNQLGATQAISSVPIVDGIFTVALNGNAEFGADAFNGDKRYLQIAVACPTGGVLQSLNPRQELTGTPYAQYALVGNVVPDSIGTDEVIDESLTGADIEDGSIGGADIADDAIQNRHIANGVITGAQIAPSTITGSNVAGNSLTGTHVQSLTGADIVNGTIQSQDIASIAPNQISPRPFQFELFDVGGSGEIQTRWPSGTWIVAVVGFHTRNGDIQENGVGDPIFVYPFVLNGVWRIRFDLRSHNTNETWRIWTMAVHRDMTTLFGNYGSP